MKDIYDSKLFIVDDETDLLHMVVGILHQEGFRHIVTAKSCQEAQTVFQQEQPDCVILDVKITD